MLMKTGSKRKQSYSQNSLFIFIMILVALILLSPIGWAYPGFSSSASYNAPLTPSILGTLEMRTPVYAGQVILVGPPGVKLVEITEDPTLSYAQGLPFQKTLMVVRPPLTGLQLSTGAAGPQMSDVIDAVNAVNVDVTGEGVIVGIVDTGVDFLSKSLGVDKIAFDEEGRPMLLDADQFGMVITPLNVTYRNPYTKMLATKGEYVEIFIPTYGKARIYVDFDWAAPSVESKSEFYKFGFMVAFMFPGNYLLRGSLPAIGYLVPAVMVDTQEPGVYDTVYLDLSTTWFTIGGIFYAFGAILEPPSIELLDFSFRDENPLKMGEGVAGLDFDGDGVYDYSLGVISGYVYDAYGLINDSVPEGGYSWETAWEPMASGIYPGLDPQGRYFSLFYDPLGHGTSVASIIAGKPAKYFIPSQEGLKVIESRGIAPDVRIAASMSLFTGNVLASLYWLSGHDYENGTWKYTGRHQADVISNSWGILYWPATLLAPGPGFPPGSDPLSLHLTNISKRVILVFAAGNEGPGQASIAMGGASRDVITVGATTVFGDPIYDAFGHLLIPEGLRSNVISWSSRGPNVIGQPKPDIVAPGAYALVPTAVINGLGDGTQAIDIFGGTSMAAPVVSGSIALILSKALSQGEEIESTSDMLEILRSSTKSLGYPYDIQGSGLIDVKEALARIVENNYETINPGESVTVESDGISVSVEFPIRTTSPPILEIEGKPIMVMNTSVTLRQYQQEFISIDTTPFLDDSGYLKIVLSTTRNITSQELPLVVAWLGGWNSSKTPVESEAEKIVLLDHGILSGRTITLFATTDNIRELREKGLLYDNTSIRILLTSLKEVEEGVRVEAYFTPLHIVEGSWDSEGPVPKALFTLPNPIDYGITLATLDVNGKRYPITIVKPLEFDASPLRVTLKTDSATHSAYLTSLGDVKVLPIRIAKDEASSLNGVVVAYYVSVDRGRADLYLVGKANPEYSGLAPFSSYYATHVPGFTVAREAFYPYPKPSPGYMIIPADIARDSEMLVVYIMDAPQGEIILEITPIIVKKLQASGKTFITIESRKPLGALLVKPSNVMAFHEGGLKTIEISEPVASETIILVGTYLKTMASIIEDINRRTITTDPHTLIKLSLKIPEARNLPT